MKVLDFGLAKALAPVGASATAAGDVTASPTITSPAMTAMGIILGTAAYMSPEQAKGRKADKRSDVWAFGAVLYEMLTGRRAFGGEDLSDTLAAVLKSEPDWSVLPADVPPPLRTLVQRCLAKDPRTRVADISTALFVMNESASLVSAAPVAALQSASAWQRPPLWRRLVLPIAALVVGGAVVGTGVWVTTRPSAPRVTRFALSSPTGPGALLVDPQSIDLTITPDGKQIVYKAMTASTGTQLFVRALDQLEPTPLTGLGIPRGPFSSPDGQWIAFVEPGPVTLKKVAITGGPVQVLCRLDGPSRGATWGDDDSIIFATALPSTGLQRVSADGGEPTVLTAPNHERGEADHLFPQFLPGSQAVLYTITPITGGIDASQVAVYDLRTKESKILLRGGSQAKYLPSGHLVYAAAGTLRAVAFDLGRLEPIGSSVPVVSQVVTLSTGVAEFDVARDGTLVYVSGGGGLSAPRTLVWVDRQGHEEAIKSAPARAYVSPRLSPDGTRVAVDIRDQGSDIWVWDFARENLTRVTLDPGIDQAPVWTPNGRRLVFSSQIGGSPGALFWQAADGSGTAEPLTQGSSVERPSQVSFDGTATRVLFTGAGASNTGDIRMLTVEKSHSVSLLDTPSMEANGAISPDGHWLAYESNDLGPQTTMAVFVRPFPEVTKEKYLVSTDGGTQPLWARNGRELFYLALNGALMSVRVEPGARWTTGTPARLIDGRYYRGAGNSYPRTYDVSLDGKRFLMVKEAGDPNQPPAPARIVVVQNWFEDLKRLVPRTR